ncbi:MAG: hypothetical protein L3J53_04570 [Proteobacteria bacterium]|nr:hypothetical protein [Pseudomonadota bacterium]
MKNYKTNLKSKQKGVTLAIGLILLLIIAVIGVNSMKSSLMQQKMSHGLSNYTYADVAAYSLLVAVENYVFELFLSNNGTDDLACSFCTNTDELRMPLPSLGSYRGFKQKDMNIGDNFPGATNVINSIAANLQDEPKFVLFQLLDKMDSGSDFGVPDPEDDSSGGGSGNVSQLINYLVVTKANDSTGNVYVLNESVVSGMIN